jgi:drug/metabolite transporter (DMT)-like permease
MANMESENFLGVFLVFASLVFDGLTNSQTDKEHKESGRDYAYSLMFSNNFVSLIGNTSIYLFYWLFYNDSTVYRILTDWSLCYDVLLIGFSGALGQIFIFFAISLFDCYILTIITTTRKLFSVVLSNFAFNHSFSAV